MSETANEGTIRPQRWPFAQDRLFVHQCFSRQVVVFDLPSMELIHRLPIAGNPSTFAVSPDGSTVYCGANTQFHIIDVASYKHIAVPYPAGGRGAACLAVAADGSRLFIGIQRGGMLPDGKKLDGGNAFLAAYDLTSNQYVGTVYLADIDHNGKSDSSSPAKMLLSRDENLLYVGMIQSSTGIKIIDVHRLLVVSNIAYTKQGVERETWADPLDLAWYKDWLLSMNRRFDELAVHLRNRMRSSRNYRYVVHQRDQNRC